MSRYSDQVRDEYGRTVPGVSIYVYKWDADADAAGDLETLTDDLSAPLANPLTSDADGLFYFNSVDGQKLIEYHFGGKVEFRDLILVGALPVPQAVFGGLFTGASTLSIPVGMDVIGTTGYSTLDKGAAVYVADAAVDAAYVTANPRRSFVSANGRGFKLSHEQEITPEMVEALADGVTNDSPAFATVGAIQAAATVYTPGIAYGVGAPQVWASAAKYALTAPWDIGLTARYLAQGTGGGGLSTQLLVAANTTGVRVQNADTNGDSGTMSVPAGPVSTGAGSIIDGFGVVGSYSGTEGEYPGFLLRTLCSLRNFQAWNKEGAGVKVWAGVSSPQLGNANFFDIFRGTIQGTRDGIELSGSDANVGLIQQTFIALARRWGVNDQSLGATYINTLTQGCGVWGDGTAAKPASAVSYMGNWFAVIAGQEVAASTTPPPVTAVNDANWISWPEGGAPSTGVPAWVSGIHLRAGGGFYSTAGALLFGCYSEGCPPSQLATSALVIGGTWGVKPHGGGQIYGGENKVQINDLNVFKGGISIADDVAGGLTVGRYAAGSPAFILPTSTSPSLFLGSPNTSHGITITNTEVTINTMVVDNTGNVLVPSGSVIKNNGTQVVGARQTGWAADTGTAKKTANATYTAGTTLTYSATYVQAEQTAMATRVAALELIIQANSQTIKALKDTLIAHGLAGA